MSKKKSQTTDPSEPEKKDREVKEPSSAEKKVAELEEKLLSAGNEVLDMKDKMLRAMADLDNTKKRMERDQVEFRRFASETCVRRLLPVIDSLKQALKAHQNDEEKGLLEGAKLIHRQLLDILKQESVEPIECVGLAYDPHLHEAVMQEEVSNPEADNMVLEELQSGYTMHGKVIRSAMVKVGKYPEKN